MNALHAKRAADVREWSIRRGAGVAGLALREVADRVLQPKEVRMAVRAVALNHRDLLIARGDMGPADRDLVPASDGAGVVVETGPAVRRFAAGDRVIANFFPDWTDGPPTPANTARGLGGALDGMLAGTVVLPEKALARAPDTLDDREAATLPCAALTAWHALFGQAQAKAGDTVLLLGTGGVSMWALALARAAHVDAIVTSSDDRKLAIARELGATGTINYRDVADWPAEVRRLTGGAGADATLDVGGRDTFAAAVDATRMGGTVAVIGGLAGGFGGAVDAGALLEKSLRVAGVLVGSRTMLESLVAFVDLHRVKPLIARAFAFDDAPAAYEALASARHAGKIVVDVQRTGTS